MSWPSARRLCAISIAARRPWCRSPSWRGGSRRSAAEGDGVEPALESRLDQLVRRHGELRDALSASGLSGGDFAKLSKEYSELSPIVDGIEALRRAQGELAAAKEMAGADGDPEMQALAEEEMQSLRERLPELELTAK